MSREITIDGTTYTDNSPPMVIAELGHNHGMDMSKVEAMVKSAKESGASAVKFQTRHPKEVYSEKEYLRRSDNPQWMARSYGRHRELLEPSPKQWRDIFQMAKDEGITAFSTPFDFKSVDLLESLDVPVYKIASGDATNIPMIEYVAQIGKPVIVSTGGCTMQDVDRIETALWGKNKQFALLQGSCVYPTPVEAMNLNVISKYRNDYDCVIGLSVHYPDIIPSIAAYAMGARIFEHHYTNDRTWKGTDNKFSLTPPMMRDLVDKLGEVRLAFGSGIKEPEEVEIAPATERRKSLYWARDVSVGQRVAREDIAVKCPGSGIPPYDIDTIINKSMKHSVMSGKSVNKSDVIGPWVLASSFD